MSDTSQQPWAPPQIDMPAQQATSTTAAAGPSPRTSSAVGVVATAVSSVVGLAVWAASKDALRRTPIDGHHVWVPLATFAAAGATWGAIHPGPRRALRTLLGTGAGATTGAIGGLLIGSTQIRANAIRDEVVSGASVGRGLIWALIGAVAWGLIVFAATPRALAGRAASTAAVGGAAIGAAMGILAVTPLGSDNPVLTDAWFVGWYALDPKIGHIAPVLVLSLAVPLLLASYAGAARRLTAPLGLAVACCVILPGIGLAAGHASDLDRTRRDDPGSISIAGEPAITSSEAATAGATNGSNGDSASPTAAVTVPVVVPPPASTDTVPTVDPSAGAAAETAPLETTVAADPTPEVVTQSTVATDIDPGFPVIIQQRFSGSNSVGEGFQGQMLIGAAFRNDAAPSAPDGGEVCALGLNDAVFPFYVQVAPYNASVSQVRITMSQTVLGVADSATYPVSIQFNDLAGPRCAAATDPDIVATAAAVQWDTLGDGEKGGEYGYVVVANYFDDAGDAIGAPSAVLAIAFELNHSASTWSNQTYGTATIDYDQGNGSAGTGFVLAP